MVDTQLNSNKFRWQWNVKIVLFALCFLPLLVSLGFWQLERAEEKRGILEQYSLNRQSAPAGLVELESSDSLQYRPARLTGRLDAEKQILLDNRVRHGLPGYEVFSVLTIEGTEKQVLVNRGWVQAALDRTILPEVPTIEGEIQLQGSLYRSLKGGFQLDDGIHRVEHWPVRVGWISVERAELLLQESFYPYQLRLDRDSLGALETGWPTVSIQPEKHIGYAVQWFLLALTLIILTVLANSNLAGWLKQRFGISRDE